MKPMYRKLNIDETRVELFKSFNRYQEVKKCWRKENNTWMLNDISFVEQWGTSEKEILVKCLCRTISTGGTVFGAFIDTVLIGFASIEKIFFGTGDEYVQLSSIHTTYEYRGAGIGTELFRHICRKAIEMGAKKIYISAHSSEESQAFYKGLGCVEAVEINREIADEEPFDCQLEYVL
jgi:ribosomal protein S18 acetylase RimI-like enzyme